MALPDVTRATVNSMLLYWSQTQPDKPAFIFRHPTALYTQTVFTRADVFTLASRYAAILRRQGVRPGDVVCNTLVNCPERLLTDLGIMLAGAVGMTGMSVLSDGADLISSVQKSRCVAVILDPKQKGNPLRFLKPLLRSPYNSVDCPDDSFLKTLIYVNGGVGQNGHKPFLEQLRKEEETFVAEVQPGDLAYIFTTSGSTGHSKLVPTSHAEYLAVGNFFFEAIGLQSDEVLFNNVDFTWAVGCPISYVARGVTRMAVDNTQLASPLSLEQELNLILTSRCSVVFSSLLLTKHIPAETYSQDHLQPKLRVVVTTGRPFFKHQLDIIGKLTESVVIIYGSTECGLLSRKVIDISNKDDYEACNNGLPVKGVKLKIVDENDQEVVEPGKTGEVLCRGPAVFSGYMGLDQDAKDNVFTRDGWFRTTDIGYFNSQGELHVVCRKSNAIITDGVLVYPGWLESRISRCPGVQSVYIVPIPDPDAYQVLCACVMREPGAKVTEQDVLDFCKTLFVDLDSPAATVPRYCVLFDSFPITSRGKPDRKAILTSAVRKLGMASAQSDVITNNIQ